MSETPVSIGDDIFYNCNSLSVIYVPSALVEEYKSSNDWINYKDIIKGIYKLTVENGSESGNFGEGEIVSIKANDNNKNGHFTSWGITRGNDIVFSNINAVETTFTMPNSDVIITAVFEAHNYVNGKCSVCGYEDPDYIISNGDRNDKTTASSVNTSDENNVIAYVTLFIISLMAIESLYIYKNKKDC